MTGLVGFAGHVPVVPPPVGDWDARATLPTSHEAAGWTESGQTHRFLAVLRQLELRAGDTLLDYGAGTGRFCEFLPRDVDYFAFDPSEGMRQRCAAEHERATVLVELPDELFDHVVAVGPFNLADGWSRERTFDRVADLWLNTARRSLIVTLYRGDDRRCLRYDPMTLAMWTKVLGVKRYVVDASYLDNDLLLGLFR